MSQCSNSDTQAENLLSRAGRIAKLLSDSLALSACLKQFASSLLGVYRRLAFSTSIASAALSGTHPHPQCNSRLTQISIMLMICSTVLGSEFFNHINPT